MPVGRFRSCSCSADSSLRKKRFEPFVIEGSKLGPFTVLLHEPGCFGMKGGNRAKVWLIKLKGSITGRVEFNDLLHPDALARGEVEFCRGDLTRLEANMANGDWDAVWAHVRKVLSNPYNRQLLQFFPSI